jgi:aryl carrier-like protein
MLREDAPGDQRLVAYVVPRGQAPTSAELKAHLSQTLPQYMVPAHFVSLEALPLTENGKVDRKALPAPERSVSEGAYVAPRTATEEILAGIWSEILGLERVGVEDNFFELGGHSLLAVSVIERMRQAGLHADVRALFTTPTLAALAAAVGDESGVVEVPPNRIPPACEAITPEMLPLVQLKPEEIEHVVAAVPGGAANVQDIYPLAPLQEGILFHNLMTSEGDPYLLFGLTGFDSRARLDGYVQALQAVVERHDILRTAVLGEGLPEPVQVVWRRAPLMVEEVSFDAAGGDVARQLAARFDPRHYRLDLRQAPLLRLFVAHDAANARWVMLQLFHHLAIDHTTMDVVQQEIKAHLLGQAGQLPVPLPFRSFVAQARLGISPEEHEAFFKKMLGDVDEPTAPFGLTDVHGDGSGIVEVRRVVDASLARRLREHARALGVSAASVCHLAWALVLARVSGREDVVFGTVLFGRMQGGEGADRVLGLLINTLPVRLRISDEPAQDSVRHTHALLAQLLSHEHAALALAQRCSAVAAPAPLFSALFNYRHTSAAGQLPVKGSEAAESWPGIECLRVNDRTNYPLVMSVDDLGEGFALTAQVQPPMVPARISDYMHSALEELVRALARAPSSPLRSLDVLPEAERQQAISGWNQGVSYAKGGCLHERFERQAERTPDAVALVFEGQRLSQSACAPPAWVWCETRPVGWPVHRALCRDGGRDHRYFEGRRRLSAA